MVATHQGDVDAAFADLEHLLSAERPVPVTDGNDAHRKGYAYIGCRVYKGVRVTWASANTCRSAPGRRAMQRPQMPCGVGSTICTVSSAHAFQDGAFQDGACKRAAPCADAAAERSRHRARCNRRRRSSRHCRCRRCCRRRRAHGSAKARPPNWQPVCWRHARHNPIPLGEVHQPDGERAAGVPLWPGQHGCATAGRLHAADNACRLRNAAGTIAAVPCSSMHLASVPSAGQGQHGAPPSLTPPTRTRRRFRSLRRASLNHWLVRLRVGKP